MIICNREVELFTKDHETILTINGKETKGTNKKHIISTLRDEIDVCENMLENEIGDDEIKLSVNDNLKLCTQIIEKIESGKLVELTEE